MSIFVVAEAGVNHNGSLFTALDLVFAAKQAGADAVKFQLFDADKLGRPALKSLQLSRVDMLSLMGRCAEVGIEFLCTPFDPDSLAWLVKQEVRRLKLASGAVFNPTLLKMACASGLPIILSTGMSTLQDVRRAMVYLDGADVTLLHCTSAYPAPTEEANLRAMITLRRAFNCPVGYSDHTVCADALIAAVALGAEVIEAHLTLDRDAEGPDHQASYEPSAFAEAVARIRRMESMLGDGEKRMQKSETECRAIWEAA